jgi:hypothetical protein
MSDPIEFEIEPDDPSRPGQINIRIVTPHDHARYIDRVFTAAAFSLYSFGYLVWIEGSDLPILIPEEYVDYQLADPITGQGLIHDSLAAAQAATPLRVPKRIHIGYAWGAGGLVVVPTIICPATTPRLVATMAASRQAYAQMVQEELTVLALSIAGGILLRLLMGVRVGPRSGGGNPQSRPAVRARAVEDRVNVGGGHETPTGYTNLNPINPNSGGPSRGIPNHIRAGFEDIAEVIEHGTVRQIISNRLRFIDVRDWNTAARGAFQVMRSGGQVSMNVWANAREAQALIRAFQQAGFRNVEVIGEGVGTLLRAVKP